MSVEVDDSALQRDRNGLRSVGNLEFPQKVEHVACFRALVSASSTIRRDSVRISDRSWRLRPRVRMSQTGSRASVNARSISATSGLEFSVPTATGGSAWRWSVLAQAYSGPAPFGQCYRQNLSSVGVGLAFTL